MQKTIPSTFLDHLHSRRTDSVLGPNQTKQQIGFRGFWVGAFLSFFLAAAAPYSNMIIRGTYMTLDFSTPGAIFLFLVLIGLLNTLFKVAATPPKALGLTLLGVAAWTWNYAPAFELDAHSPGLIFSSFAVLSIFFNLVAVQRGGSMALNRAELILVYAMLLIVSALCTMGLGEQILPLISSIFYFASPENKWTEHLLPHLPPRIMVDDGNNNQAFYEGLAKSGGDIPYDSWLGPMAWWAIFLLALYITMVSIAVILRRQWMERERLAYPLAQVGLEMIRGEDGEKKLNAFFKQKAMWFGAAIPLIIGGLKGWHRYDPSVPVFNLDWKFRILDSQILDLSVRYAIIGFSYLINANIAAGIWFFHLLSKVEKDLFVTIGLKSPQKTTFGVSDHTFIAYQNVGALIAMVLVLLWTGRHHLRNVLLKALGRAPQVEDDDEIMSYRAAVAGSLGGIATMVIWLWFMGTPFFVALLFIVTALLILTGITRIVAEAGLPVVRSPMATPDLLINGLGGGFIGPTGVFNIALSYMWAADTRVFVMGTCTNALKLIEEMSPRNRRLIFWAIILALFIGTLGAFWMIFYMAYRHGGINLNSWFFDKGPAMAYNIAQRNIEPPSEFYWPGAGFFVGGGVVMALMMWARQRFFWWPFHPVGFPVGANSQFMNPIWFSVFLAWAIKKIILKFGGAAAYQRCRPFFLGLIAGQMMINGFWLIVDYFTGRVGNHIFGI